MDSTVRFLDYQTFKTKKSRRRTVSTVLFIVGIGMILAQIAEAGTLEGLIGPLLFAAAALIFAVVLWGPPKPNVQCQSCRAVGWKADVEVGHGACIRCGHDRFLVNGKRRSGQRLRIRDNRAVLGTDIVIGDVILDGDATGGDGDGAGDGDGGDGGGDGD